MELPREFVERMEKLLGQEAEALLEQYQQEDRLQGLRANSLKVSAGELERALPFSLRPVPWCPEGFYYGPEDRPGLHPWHEAGLYYMQEPSAMAVGVLTGPKPGERVLDLCAAPGGKSTHLAAQMGGEGFLLCNEIHPGRAKILAENVERMGIWNCAVSNESPQALADRLPGYFDRVVVDAPCSGEGMFRKNPIARQEWSLENIARCAQRQDEILDCAVALLRPGGTLIYSTCTFAPEEDEGTVARLLERHGMEVEQACFSPLFAPGVPQWGGGRPELARTARLWPHRLEGEGHFMARMRKGDGACCPPAPQQVFEPGPPEWQAFAQQALDGWQPQRLVRYGHEGCAAPKDLIPLQGLRVLRPGLHLGTQKKGRMEPGHALAMALGPGQAPAADWPVDSPEIQAYLRGETLPHPGQGWCLVTASGHSLGWGKLAGGVLKNHRPKGLRRSR